ncbi:MAG: class I SAM-dependent methyltransferase [Bacteroidia bacterium]|jgi:2-polyprenyl-3-methyl-5-hydroxy-6-metoxy-1,4-benzoquinol methylase
MAFTKEELDQIAGNFTEEVGFEVDLQKYKIAEISKFIAGESMLDVGCGVGAMTKAYEKRFKRIVGIDGSEVKISKALNWNSAPNIEYILTFFEDYKPKEKFDFIVSTNVLEHVDDSVEFLKNIKSWLNPGGRVVMTVPNALGLHKRIGLKMGVINDLFQLTEADYGKGHKRIYDRAKLNSDFEQAGYSVVYLGGILLKPLSHKQMETWDKKIVDALYEIGLELPDYCSSLIIVGTIS